MSSHKHCMKACVPRTAIRLPNTWFSSRHSPCVLTMRNCCQQCGHSLASVTFRAPLAWFPQSKQSFCTQPMNDNCFLEAKKIQRATRSQTLPKSLHACGCIALSFEITKQHYCGRMPKKEWILLMHWVRMFPNLQIQTPNLCSVFDFHHDRNQKWKPA